MIFNPDQLQDVDTELSIEEFKLLDNDLLNYARLASAIRKRLLDRAIACVPVDQINYDE